MRAQRAKLALPASGKGWLGVRAAPADALKHQGAWCIPETAGGDMIEHRGWGGERGERSPSRSSCWGLMGDRRPGSELV